MLWQSYFIPGSGVLRNELGITDAVALRDAEYAIAGRRLHQLERASIAVVTSQVGDALFAAAPFGMVSAPRRPRPRCAPDGRAVNQLPTNRGRLLCRSSRPLR